MIMAKTATASRGADSETKVVSKKDYEKELERLQTDLVRLQEWVVHEGLRVMVIFEGRDTAGKGGSMPAIAGSSRSAPRTNASAASGTSSATSPTCRQRGRSCSLTAAGTTAPALSA
jgi:polyphosphate kinase 2 (PPK2 family)